MLSQILSRCGRAKNTQDSWAGEDRNAHLRQVSCERIGKNESNSNKTIRRKLWQSACSASKTGTETHVPNMPNQKMVEDSSSSSPFDLTLFVLSSARAIIDESNRYGPKRLFDTLVRLLDMQGNSSGENAEFFASIREKILKSPSYALPQWCIPRSSKTSLTACWTDSFQRWKDNAWTNDKIIQIVNVGVRDMKLMGKGSAEKGLRLP